ncbi:MAG TPA: S8 family serine peptidase, partial [Actinomycetota bacterium]|nr:S8 family serine peptidase [Actinomycetota bacterium]
RTLFDAGAKYCYAQGTSMAGPHVVGVAALIASRYGPLAPGELAAFVEQSAESLACPDPYEPQGTDFPRLDGSPQECQGGTGNNSFYGAGEVNAYNAVTL